MRPVSDEFPVTQPFGSLATAGVAADPNGTEVQQLVAEYGNYQPYGHAGQDIGCPIGTPVHAIAAGTVLWADWGTNLPGDESWSPSGYFARWALYKTFPGIVTVIQHDGWISVYAHLSDAPLNPGDVVTEGQQIALSGNTRSPGVSLGAHLHVEALVDLSYSTGNGLVYGRTDPTPYFGGIAAQGTVTPTEGFLMALTEDEQRRVLAAADMALDTPGRAPGPRLLTTNEGAYIVEQVAGHAQNLWNGVQGIPAGVLNQTFKLADGTVTNLAGILTAIHAQPTAGTVVNQTSDPSAVVAAIKAQWNK